jgi:hypothetical protein
MKESVIEWVVGIVAVISGAAILIGAIWLIGKTKGNGEGNMTNEYDFNGNGIIDPEEREIMIEDRRRKMEDADAKRDAQRQMTWFALSGMVLYPLAIILASALGYSEAAGLIADIATVYVVAVSGVTAAYFGFNAMESNK